MSETMIPSGPLQLQKLSQSAGPGSAAHARAGRGVAQACQRRLRPSVVRPRREDGPEQGAARDVGILVGGEAKAVGLRALDEAEDLVHACPVASARELQMGDVDRAPRLTGDRDHLLDRLHDAVALAAHVHDEGTPRVGQHSTERHQLGGVRIAAGRVDQARGQAAGPFREGQAEQRLHRLGLVGGGPPVIAPHHVLPERSVRGEVGHVGDGARPGDAAQVAADARPVPRHPEVAEQPGQLLLPGRPILVLHRRDRDAVLAEHLERDPLPHLHGQRGVGEDLHVGMAVRVDEAGRHDVTRAIEARVAGKPMPHRDHAALSHGHVRGERRSPRAVDDRPAPQDEGFRHLKASPWRCRRTSLACGLCRTASGRGPSG
jgi:hypothetical protein